MANYEEAKNRPEQHELRIAKKNFKEKDKELSHELKS